MRHTSFFSIFFVRRRRRSSSSFVVVVFAVVVVVVVVDESILTFKFQISIGQGWPSRPVRPEPSVPSPGQLKFETFTTNFLIEPETNEKEGNENVTAFIIDDRFCINLLGGLIMLVTAAEADDPAFVQ